MPEVMDPDHFHAGRFASAFHLVSQKLLREGEDPVTGFHFIQHAQIVLDLFAQESRHPDDAAAFRRLGVSDDISAVTAVISLGDRQRPIFQIEIRRRQR